MVFNAGLLIKHMRTVKGLTQKQLAEGICARTTITEIEKGNRKPEWFIFRQVMLRLGMDPEQYYKSIADEDEIFLINKFFEWDNLVVSQKHDVLHEEMEKYAPRLNANQSGKEILLSIKSSMYIRGPYQNLPLAYKTITETLKQHRRDFAIEKIPSYFLSPMETSAINKLAIYHKHSGDTNKTIEVYTLLKQSLENSPAFSASDNKGYNIVTINLAVNLYETKRYEECIQIINKALESRADWIFDIRYCRRLLNYKAYSLLALGKKDEATEYIRKTLAICYATDGFDFYTYKEALAFSKDKLGEAMDLALPQ